MIICQCRGTTEAAIRKAVRQGARTVAEVGAACQAGTECEGCHEAIARIITEECGESRRETESVQRPIRTCPKAERS